MDTHELIRRAEQELAVGSRSARKTLERVRRRLLEQEDIQGLEHLLQLAARLEDRGNLAHAIRQNIRFLSRKAQTQSGELSAPSSAHKTAGPQSFLFGDARRPRSLALAYIASIASFPFFWLGLVIVWGLADGGPYSIQQTQHAERVIVVIAAIAPVLGIVAGSLDWLSARRSHPSETRKALLSREGVWSGAAVLAVLGAAFGLGTWLWNTLL